MKNLNWRYAAGTLLVILFVFPESADAQPGKAAANLSAVPKDGLGYQKRADSLLERGRYEEALADYIKAAELLPTDTDPLIGQGQALRELKRTDDAIAALTKALELDPKSGVALDQLGVTYGQTKSYDLAKEKFAAAIALDESNEFPYLHRAQMFFSQGKRSSALDDLDKLVAFDTARKPDAPYSAQQLQGASLAQAYFYRSLVNGRHLGIVSKDAEKAVVIADATQAVRLDPRLAIEYQTNAGELLSTTDAKYGVTALLTGAAAVLPNDAALLVSLGDAQCTTFDSDKAIVNYTRALAIAPKSASALRGRALAYANIASPYNVKQWSLAVADWESFVALKPNDITGLSELGIGQYNVGLTEEGIASFRKILLIEPENAYTHLMLGLGLAIKDDAAATTELKNYAAKLEGEEIEKAKSNAGNAKTHYPNNDAVEAFFNGLPYAPDDSNDGTFFLF